ncbi:MAG TPA: multidrug ABC transporter ATP-binding protein [Firmicutes bacterium]|nr:multidrug ABC transporter ATP-binding protein [Bacillota bacterium]
MSKTTPVARPGIPGGPGMQNMMKEKVKLDNPKETLFRLLTYITDKKLMLVFVVLLGIISTLVTIIGTKYNGDIVDDYVVVGDMSGLAKICIILVVMYMVSAVTTWIQNRLMVEISQMTGAKIRRELFEKMQSLPIKYFDTHSSGDLMSRLTNDVDNISMTLSQSISQFTQALIMIVGMLIAMSLLSPSLMFVGLLTTPIMFLTTRLVVKWAQPYFIERQQQLGALNGYVEEMVSGQKAVLLFSQEEKVGAEFSVINKELTKSAILAESLSALMGPLMNFIGNLTYLILAVCGAYFILLGWDITVGVIFTIILYMRNFNRPINELMNLANTIQSALAGAERVFEVMDVEPEQDKPQASAQMIESGEVEFKDVEFSYNPHKKILKGINLTAKKGQTIAIVGPTGSGKTTIVNLLNKFYDINGGDILIDGRSIDEYELTTLRKCVSIVLQDTFLFTDSVLENIRYGNLEATEDEVIAAAKLANAHKFIKQLPQGYHTVLADNGSNLSLGQRQLLAIARAILAKSAILILDEATSSIDTRTEVEIQEAMVNLMKGKTTFIIAHRLSTIQNADLIIAVKDGEIIERGTHEELLGENGFYASLYQSQFRSGLSL